MKKSTDRINYKKLFFELMIVLSVIFVAVCAILYPILKAAGAFDGESDRFAAYRDVLDYVDNYDYSKGRDLEFEKKVDEVYYSSNNGDQVYAYAMARGTYYCNVNLYMTANAAFAYLDSVAPPNLDDHVEAESRKIVCNRKQNNDV